MTERNVEPGVLLPLSPDEVAFLLALIDFVKDDGSPHRLVEWLAAMDDLEAKLRVALELADGRIPESR
jgi:hypothetical protein